MKRALFLITMIFITGVSRAQITLWEDLKQASANDSIDVESGNSGYRNDDSMFAPEGMDLNVDSLLNLWNFNYFTRKQTSDGYSNPPTSDAEYKERLERLPRVIPMTFNETVRSCINLYTERSRSLTEYILGWSDFYFPMIEETLERYDLPLELKYLAIVESALNPIAQSRMGASGLWQFMLPTGKVYGLEINSLVDERRDPVKSTEAACKYFKDMYAIYGDWHLVIASYNCGPGNVNKAIKRAKGKSGFWDIYPYLPRETRMYVPLFMAVNYVMNYYTEHNLSPTIIPLPLSTDTVMINKEIHFDQIADILKIDKEQLRALNPQYKRDIIPGQSKPYVLTLPAVYAYGFVELEDTISSHRSDELFAHRSAPSDSPEKIRHTVRSGESLLAIANKYGVSVSQIRSWNGLKKSSKKIPAGQTLTIYADTGGYSLSSTSETSETTDEDAVVSPKKTKTKSSEKGSYSIYKVRSGDSFHTIAKKYPGVSAQELMKFNGTRNTSLKVGQRIKVPRV